MSGQISEPSRGGKLADPPADVGLASPVVQLADALDRLVARVERDCNVEASEGTLPSDPAWAEVVEELAVYAEQCREVFANPDVAAALAADSSW